MQLEDGTHIVFSKRYDLMVANGEDTTGFIPAHPDFRVIALGCPTRTLIPGPISHPASLALSSLSLTTDFSLSPLCQLPTRVYPSTLPSALAFLAATSTPSKPPRSWPVKKYRN